MSTGYATTGRVRQKARTRDALIRSARALLAQGEIPTIEQTADHAEVSRTTAYRYFPNQRALFVATYPEVDAQTLLSDPKPTDPIARVESFCEGFLHQLLEHEPELRAQLRISLDARGKEKEDLLFRQGRAVRWIADALEPLRETLSPERFRRLVLAIRATMGIEALVWLTDMAGVSPTEASEIMRSSVRTLVEAAIAETDSPKDRA